MVKAIIFDLDNVLVDADQWHFDALNNALASNGEMPISRMEHVTIYKGNPTKVKLEILTERRGLPKKLWAKISKDKQTFTEESIKQSCIPVQEKIEMLKMLGTKYRLAVCSNAIRSTVKLMLDNSGLTKHIEFYLSNEDVH